MIAGLDIGGTKMEARIYDADWREVSRLRRPTPEGYDGLIDGIAQLVEDASEVPVEVLGIGVPGLIHPTTGLAKTANLPATGKPFAADIHARVGRPVTILNDCRAFALSEAVFGAGRGHDRVAAVIIGTGIGGGLVENRAIKSGPTLTGGEFGHTAAPAHLVVAHDLPVERCGCGRMGCIETYVAGPGLAALALHMTGQDVTPAEIADARDGAMAAVWTLWCALAGELLHNLVLTVDPDVIVSRVKSNSEPCVVTA